MKVTKQINCPGCGYRLRGFYQDGKCPECNLPIVPTMKRKPRTLLVVWILLVAFTLFHLVFVAFPIVAAHGNGEVQAWTIVIFDFPLYAVLKETMDPREFNNMGGERWALMFAVGGTIMYAAVGAALGLIIDTCRLAYARRSTPEEGKE